MCWYWLDSCDSMKGHPGILHADHFDPNDIYTGLTQVVPTVRVPLNTWGKADYYMVDSKNNERMVERKQLSEALSDLDAVEEQLGRHLHECDELTLLVEGVGIPTPRGVQTWEYSENTRTWSPGYTHKNQPALWKRWTGFKYSLRHHAGVEIEEVSTWHGTVQFLITWFQKSMDPTSTTMQRYVIPHIGPMDKNPHIDNLCRLRGMDIGESTAIKLVAEFDTLSGVITASFSDLVGVMGGAWARKFISAIGRGD